MNPFVVNFVLILKQAVYDDFVAMEGTIAPANMTYNMTDTSVIGC